EHPTTGTHVHEVDTGLLQTGGALDVVAVVRVATVDDDVAGLETRHELLGRRFDESSGNHDPHRSRLLELRAEVAERVRTDRALALELFHHRGLAAVTHTLVPIANQPPHQVGTHPAETDHSKLHLHPFALSGPARSERTCALTRRVRTSTFRS